MKNARMIYSFDAPTRELRWTFGNGIEDVAFTAPDAPMDSLVFIAMVHGFKQKIADTAAMECDTETGKSAPMVAKRAAMQTVVERLNAGEWNATRTGATPKTVDVDSLIAAMAAATGKSVIGVRAYVEGRTEEQRKALVANDKYREGYAIALVHKRPAGVLSDEDEAEIDAIA